MSNQVSNSDLRPRTIGQLLDDSFRLFRNHFRFIAAATLCVYLPYLVLQSLLAFDLESALNGLESVKSEADLALVWSDIAPRLLGVLLMAMASALLVVPLLYGSLLRLLAELKFQGVTLSFKDAFVHAWRRLLAVIGTGILKWLLLIVLYIVCSAGLVLVIAVLGLAHASAVVTAILAVLLGIAALCVVIWISVKFAFAMSVALEEKKAGWSAIVRSWQLVKGNFWRVIGFFIVVRVIVFAVEIGLNMIFHLIPSFAVQTVLDNVVSLLTTPFVLMTTGLLYLDLRVRTDAPDFKDWLDGGSGIDQ